MKRLWTPILMSAALAGALLAPVMGEVRAAPPGSPVAINGQLRVCKTTKLCNRHGNPVQLRGMSTHGTQWYRQCITGQSLDVLADDWKADILRVSTYVQEGSYETDPEKFTDIAHRIIEQATARGLYVIVDWHILDIDGDGGEDQGDPFYNLKLAKQFFTAIATRHKNKPNIFYEVANEPSGVAWDRLKRYHEKIIPVIREIDPNAVIILGTREFSSFGVTAGADESEVISDPVEAPNVMYTFHFYAASHGASYFNVLKRAAKELPVFVTEFGTQLYTGGGENDFEQTEKYLDFLEKEKISWANWNYSDDPRSGAAFKPGVCEDGIVAGTSQLKTAGKFIRRELRTPDSFPTD